MIHNGSIKWYLEFNGYCNKNLKYVALILAEARRASKRLLLGFGGMKESEEIGRWRKDNPSYAVAEYLATLYH